jgi:hypothetical protein
MRKKKKRITFPMAEFRLFLFVLLIVFQPMVKGQSNMNDIANSIDIKNLQHPYLFFNSEEKQDIINRIKTNNECSKIFAAIKAEGHRYLHVPIKTPPPINPKHPRYVNEEEGTFYMREINNGAMILAFLYQITGDSSYAGKAIQFALAVSDLTDWVNEAHKFDIIYPRVWPWGVPDERYVFSFDIYAAGIAITLATTYDWLYPVLNQTEKDKIRGALLEKAILRVRKNYDYFWWSSAFKCNWSAICYTGLAVPSIALLKDNPELVDVISECYNRINKTFDQIGQEGGWQEGRGYYGYMMREGIFFMDALKRLTKGRYNLFTHETIANHPLDIELYGLTANFEDSGGDPVGPVYMLNKLVAETKNNSGAFYRDKYFDEGNNVFEIIWPKPDVKPIEPKPASKLFKTINWAMLRSNFDNPSSVTIACKAGNNDDPHHGHLDCGQFILTWYDVPFIRDIGRMGYDEFYFNQDRWNYPFASSIGHNVIMVNEEQQIPAKLKNQPWKEGIGGNILDFRTSDKQDYVLMDPTHAYPNKELKKWRRSIVLQKPDVTLLFDEVEAQPDSKIEDRFFPGVGRIEQSERFMRNAGRQNGNYEVLDKFVFLSDSKQHNMALIPLVLDNNFKMEEDKLPFIPVTADARMQYVNFFEIVVNSKSDNSIIATLILPVENKKEADEIIKSSSIKQVAQDEIEVNLNSNKGQYNWYFQKTENGYVLKQ